MDKLLDALMGTLLSQGPVVLMALAAVVFLHRDNQQLKTKVDALQKQILKLQEDCQDELLEEREKRVTEQKDATAAVRESNNALKETVAALRSMRSSKSVPPTSANG